MHLSLIELVRADDLLMMTSLDAEIVLWQPAALDEPVFLRIVHTFQLKAANLELRATNHDFDARARAFSRLALDPHAVIVSE